MLFDEFNDNSNSSASPAPQRRPAQFLPPASGWAIILVLALLAGLVGGIITVWWGQPWLNRISTNTNLNVTDQAPPARLLPVQEESATTDVVKKVSPSVVSIIVSKDLSKIYNLTGPPDWPFDNFFDFGFPFNFFFGQGGQSPQSTPPPQGKQEVGGGTGFVINQARGLILTNRHVVQDTEADYTVLTNDGQRFSAKVVARDPVNDMALVQIEDKSLPALELGDSDAVEIGQTVIAIGNALGEYRNTVTKGVISGIGRNVVAGGNSGGAESLQGVFQTDAAINPGNSGGPLVNLAGQVIGINTAVSREGQLIGFAIPVNEAKRMIDSFLRYGRIVRPYLGIRYIVITPELARVNKLKFDYGAWLVRGRSASDLAVIPGGPADKAGLVENDIILQVNGDKIEPSHSLVKILSKFQPGDKVKLKVYHRDEIKDIEVVLAEFEENK